MVCIYCQHRTQIINSRPQKRLGSTWRRHECTNCHAVFTTIETIDYAASWRLRGVDGRRQPFERDTLYISLYQALGHRKDAVSAASALTATIIAKIREKAQSALIERKLVVETTLTVLNNFDKVAAVQYGAYHPLDR